MDYTINKVAASHSTYSKGRGGKSVKYIVIHYTGTTASARNNGIYFSGGNRSASAHYFIDSNEIIQSVQDTDTAWAVGNFDMNQRSISIEIVSGGDDFSSDEIKKASYLVQMLMAKYNVSSSRVIRHYDVADYVTTGNTIDPHKGCPAPYIDSQKWTVLKEQLTTSTIKEDDGLTGIHMSMAVNTNRNKWKRENGNFVNMAWHNLLECEGDKPVGGAAVRAAEKRDNQAISDKVQYWDIEQFDSDYMDKYIVLHPHGKPDLALTRTKNSYGAGVTLEKSTNELNQKWTAVWAGSTNVYRLFAVGTYYVLTADKE